jgi:protein SCO1/2
MNLSKKGRSRKKDMLGPGILTVAVFASQVLVRSGEIPSRLAVIAKAPEIALTAHTGQVLRPVDLKNKVLLVSFIFTTCNGTCPATTHRMCLVEEELKKRGLFKGDRVHLLSITLDPARDTPEVLRNYMRLYDVDSVHWSFLTGTPADVAKIIAAWGMWARPAANGQLDHPSRIFLVDQRGRIREIYNLSFLKPTWVVEDIELLLKEGR